MNVTEAGGQTPVANQSLRTRVWELLLRLLVGRRRRYMVNRRYQLRVSLLTLSLVLVLLVLLNLSAYFLAQASTDAVLEVRPEMKPDLQAKDRFQVGVMLVGSLLFALGVFALGILHSHKTAGAAFNLCRCLRRIQDGEYNTFARLRRDDNLKEVAEAFNDMAQRLQAHTRTEIEALQALAATADKITADPAGRELASKLRSLIEEQKHRLAE